MRAAGCFAHIDERYAWQRRRAMTPAPNPARPVLGRGTTRCGAGTGPGLPSGDLWPATER
jgi:hypothetical protein